MEKKLKSKKVYVTYFTLKSANGKIVSSKSGKGTAARKSVSGKFFSRDELKEAFKTASRRMKSAS